MKRLIKRAVCGRCETTFSLYSDSDSREYIVESQAAEKHCGSASWAHYNSLAVAINVWAQWADCDCLPADKERGDG